MTTLTLSFRRACAFVLTAALLAAAAPHTAAASSTDHTAATDLTANAGLAVFAQALNKTGYTTTNINTDGRDRALAVAAQSDGKIIVAADVGQRLSLVRYNTNGSIDTTFGTGGQVLTENDQPRYGAYPDSTHLIVQSDGKIIVIDRQTIRRYNTNGATDHSFGDGNFRGSSFVGRFIALAAIQQSDGKIVIAGGRTDFELARFNTDGTVDTSFDTDGKTTTDIGTSTFDSANSVAVQSDGKIVVAGRSSDDFAVARFNTDGSLDTSFDTDGKLSTDADIHIRPGGKPFAVQSDGKIAIAGSPRSSGAIGDFAVARFNSDGSLDTSFDTDGKTTTDIGSSSYDAAVAVISQPGGKIVVAGESAGDIAIVRYNTDGSLDTSFDTDGKVVTALSTNSFDILGTVALQSDGKIVVAGESQRGRYGSGRGIVVARYQPGGSLDTTFDGDGIATDDASLIGSYNRSRSSVAVQSDGKIVVAGTSGEYGDFAIVRYNADGSLDTSFDTDGKTTTDIGTSTVDSASSVAIQSDGKIVVAGTSGDRRRRNNE